jgi:hypothetical protein
VIQLYGPSAPETGHAIPPFRHDAPRYTENDVGRERDGEVVAQPNRLPAGSRRMRTGHHAQPLTAGSLNPRLIEKRGKALVSKL